MAIADVENILKHDYKNLTSLLNDTPSPTIAQLDRTTDSIHGDYAVIAMEVGREFGIGARLENEVLPVGESVEPEQAHVKVKRIYGSYKVTVPEIAAMETDKGAFTRSTARRVKNLKAGLSRDYSREGWGDGSGRLATCGTTTNSLTVQLAATTPEQALVNLAEGMRVDIGTNAAPQVVAAGRKVISVDFALAQVVIEGPAVTTTSSHFLFRQGAGGAPQTATQREITGLGRIIDDDTTLQNLDPATVWNWKCMVEANGGTLRPPSENLVEKALHRLEARSGAEIDFWVAGDEVYRACVNMLKGKQRQVNEQKLRGGHEGVDFGFGAGVKPLMRDKDMSLTFPNSLIGIERSSMRVYMQHDWRWEDTDGSVLRLASDRTHTLEALYYTFRELGIEQRNHNVRVDDIEGA